MGVDLEIGVGLGLFTNSSGECSIVYGWEYRGRRMNDC